MGYKGRRNFRERRACEVRRIPLLRTRVNKGKERKGQAEMPQPFRHLRLATNRSPHPLVGSQPSLALLIGGASFHIGAAILMRLNTFLWAFVATYHAIIFCAHAVVLPSLLIAEI